MNNRWYPATVGEPKTCATFEVMRKFHVENLQGNITPYDFYKSLEAMSDPWQSTQLPVRPLTL